MAAALPTAKQADVLRALAADPATKVPAATRRSLLSRGWITQAEGGTVTPTERGLAQAERRFSVDIYQALPREASRRVSVSNRTLGRTMLARGGRPRSGRNVDCWTCRQAGRDWTVWSTNESGAPAQREAEIAAAVHYARHASGDLEPFADAESKS